MGNNPTVKVTIEAENLLSADLKQVESQFLQVEQAGKKTASAVSALFNSMDDEQFSVQATWQRAMDDVKAATAKAVNDANKEITKLGKDVSSDRLAGSFKDLGIKSALDISTEKARLVAAFEAIKKSGVASADEIKRAEKALQEQLQKIDGALDSNKRKANEATGGISTGLKGVAAWLAAAFSVDRVVAFTKAAFEASMAVDAIVGKLKVMSGSDQAAAEELSFIRVEANRLGLDLLETAKAYGSFMTAVKGTANEGKQSRAMFIGITEGMNAVRLSADEQSRAWVQLNQGIMKGKFEMQDLKAIAESGLPIFQLLANAYGITTKELMQMQHEGRLLADDALPKLAESMHKTFGVAAVEAAGKGRAELNKFNTAVFELKAYLAQSFEGNGLGALTGLVEMLKSVVLYAQLGKIEVVALFEKFSALVDNGGFIGLMGGGKEARNDLKEQFAAIDAMTELSIKKRREQYTNWSAAAKQAEKDVAGAAQAGTVQTREEAEKAGQIRRDNAKKTGEDLAKINVEFAKQTGDAEAQLTADLLKQYEERKKATIDFWNQKKAAAKDDIEEASYEIIKNQKLQQIEAQHLRDVEIIQAAAKSRRLDSLKDEIALETLLVQEKVAKNEMTAAQGERRITELTVAAAKAQYDAKKATTDAYVGIYGKQGEDYKKLLKDQDAAHKEYLSASLSAYKTYADNIKAIDQQIKDFKSSVEDKIRDIRQKGMTDAQKYADDQQRVQETFSKASRSLAEGDTQAAKKLVDDGIALAARLADKKAESNTKMEEEQKRHQERMNQIDQQGTDTKQTDQQKIAAEKAKENEEHQKKVTDLLKEQAATQQGISSAEQAMNQFKELGVQIREKEKQQNVDALEKLKQIQDMKLDPKNLAVNMDQGALTAVKSEIDALTKDATKTIYIKTVGASGEASYSDSGSVPGFFAGGKVTNGSPLRDSVHAMLAGNEWVINNKAAGFWGDNLLAAINAPLSSSGRRLQAAMAGVTVGNGPAALPNMGTINLNVDGFGSLPVQAPIDVYGELQTALRRRAKLRPNP